MLPRHCRAGVTPFLAAHLHGYDNFKWMLYGDDDTVFFIDNVLDMLEGLDHNMPYFLTDHLWFPDQFGKLQHPASGLVADSQHEFVCFPRVWSGHAFCLALSRTMCGSVTRLARVWHNVLGLLANLQALACVDSIWS